MIHTTESIFFFILLNNIALFYSQVKYENDSFGMNYQILSYELLRNAKDVRNHISCILKLYSYKNKNNLII